MKRSIKKVFTLHIKENNIKKILIILKIIRPQIFLVQCILTNE